MLIYIFFWVIGFLCTLGLLIRESSSNSFTVGAVVCFVMWVLTGVQLIDPLWSEENILIRQFYFLTIDGVCLHLFVGFQTEWSATTVLMILWHVFSNCAMMTLRYDIGHTILMDPKVAPRPSSNHNTVPVATVVDEEIVAL